MPTFTLDNSSDGAKDFVRTSPLKNVGAGKTFRKKYHVKTVSEILSYALCLCAVVCIWMIKDKSCVGQTYRQQDALPSRICLPSAVRRCLLGAHFAVQHNNKIVRRKVSAMKTTWRKTVSGRNGAPNKKDLAQAKAFSPNNIVNYTKPFLVQMFPSVVRFKHQKRPCAGKLFSQKGIGGAKNTSHKQGF